MNEKLARRVRDPDCKLCKMCRDAEDVCVTASGPSRAKIMVVGKMPNSSAYQSALDAELEAVGIDPATVSFTQALKCRNWDENPSKTDQKACKPYLEAEIELVKPKWILALGNEALMALTGHSGIMKHRGRIIQRGDTSIIPTISPAAVRRNPGQREGIID